MVATRSMSGTTKKASDTRKAVNQKVAKRASKKTCAITTSTSKEERERERKERRVMEEAREFFVRKRFLPLFLQEHPDVIHTIQKGVEIMREGDKEWDSMSGSDKAPYLAWATKKYDDLQLYKKGLFLRYQH